MSKKFRLYATINNNAGCKDNNPFNPSQKYANMLFLLRGKEVEIETDYLFIDQLNTVPIKGISDNGLRLHLYNVKSLRIENRTFLTIKMRIKRFYKKSWNIDLTEHNFCGWKHILGID